MIMSGSQIMLQSHCACRLAAHLQLLAELPDTRVLQQSAKAPVRSVCREYLCHAFRHLCGDVFEANEAEVNRFAAQPYIHTY